jgi:hypothetical protein
MVDAAQLHAPTMADTIIEMPFIANYQAVYNALNVIVKKIVNESYFKLWQKAEAENISLRAELAALRAPECTTPLRFHPKPTLLPLYGPDSPV